VFLFLLPAAAQTTELSKSVNEIVRVDAAKVVLTHVRAIDGKGAPAVEDQNVVVEGGKISVIRTGTERVLALVAQRRPAGVQNVLNTDPRGRRKRRPSNR
jgi:hypothetical protein